MNNLSQKTEKIPPVDEMPILTDMRKYMDADLAVSEDGKAYVFYEKILPEELDHVEYDIDEGSLYLIGLNGRIQNLGMKIHAPVRKHLEKAKDLHLVHITKKGESKTKIVSLVLIVRRTDL